MKRCVRYLLICPWKVLLRAELRYLPLFKTVTNAEVITLNRFCLGKVAAVASLVMKLDSAERESDPNLLTNSLDYLLGDITRKVLI